MLRTKIAQFFNGSVFVFLLAQVVVMACGFSGMFEGLPTNTANALILFALLGFVPAMVCSAIADIFRTEY